MVKAMYTEKVGGRFFKGSQRVPLQDTRAMFVTVSLVNEKSEAWVRARTGHRSSTMIAKYRRAARMAIEVGMGSFVRSGVDGEHERAAVLH